MDADSVAKGLTIGDGTGSVVLEIGSDDGASSMLVLADGDVDLCGAYVCSFDDLTVPTGYVATGLGSGLSWDVETGL